MVYVGAKLEVLIFPKMFSAHNQAQWVVSCIKEGPNNEEVLMQQCEHFISTGGRALLFKLFLHH